MDTYSFDVARPFRPSASGQYFLTDHAVERMSGRSFSTQSIEKVLTYGRVEHVKGARYFVVGKKEVGKYADRGVDLSDCEGVHVVCSSEGAILTVYRNRSLKSLREPRRSRCWS